MGELGAGRSQEEPAVAEPIRLTGSLKRVPLHLQLQHYDEADALAKASYGDHWWCMVNPGRRILANGSLYSLEADFSVWWMYLVWGS